MDIWRRMATLSQKTVHHISSRHSAISAAIIQNSGPRRILLANCGDGLAAFFPLLNPFSLGIFTFLTYFKKSKNLKEVYIDRDRVFSGAFIDRKSVV